MSQPLSVPSIDEVFAAQKRIYDVAIRTPLLKLNFEIPDIEIYIKCEQFQSVSSFKIRSAANAVHAIPKEEQQRGLVTASAGNMGQGIAFIAEKDNLKCQVLVPNSANEVKLKEIERLGAKITTCSFEEWWQVIVTKQCPMLDGHFIHPVYNRHIIAGNGTIALEILDELPDCDAIFVPYGGGALTVGIASAAKHMKPSIDVFACEIETAAPLAAAFQHNEITTVPVEKSWIDGIGSFRVLDEMWPLVKSYVDNSIVVTLNETAKALKLLIERNHIICEGASATALAAALYHYKNYVETGRAGTRREKHQTSYEVVAVLTGSGIDNKTIIKCLQETL